MSKSGTAVALAAIVVETIEEKSSGLEFGTEKTDSPLITAGLDKICFGLDESGSNPDDPMALMGWT